jgi:hypothetical protein
VYRCCLRPASGPAITPATECASGSGYYFDLQPDQVAFGANLVITGNRKWLSWQTSKQSTPRNFLEKLIVVRAAARAAS